MNKEQLIKKLKLEYFNDFCVLMDSSVFGFKYWIYSDRKHAKENLKRITNNCDLLKPCTVELVGLF